MVLYLCQNIFPRGLKETPATNASEAVVISVNPGSVASPAPSPARPLSRIPGGLPLATHSD